jgi:hypothetical protein
MANIIAPHCENNDGVGLYLKPYAGTNEVAILGLYTERNTQDAVDESRATKHWGVWYVGTNSNNYGIKFINANLQQSPSGGGDYEWVRLTGTGPDSWPEGALEFNGLRAGGISSDWSGYRLLDAHDAVLANITGTAPKKGGARVNAGFSGEILRVSATIDFPSIPSGSQRTTTVTVNGAAFGDAVVLGLPGSDTSNVVYSAYVSTANTVTIKAMNIGSSSSDPSNQQYRIYVIRDPAADITA